MKDINIAITKEALLFLSRVTQSCKSACSQDMKAFKAYVARLAKSGKNTKLSKFITESPSEVTFLRDLVSFAEKEKLAVVKGEDILKFFGSRWHISKILSDMKENLVEDSMLRSEYFRKGFLFDHTLTLHCIHVTENKILQGCYQHSLESECLFVNSKLVCPDEKSGLKLRDGDKVLLHFGEVVAVNPPDEVVKFISKEQRKSRDFMEAVSYLEQKGGI